MTEVENQNVEEEVVQPSTEGIGEHVEETQSREALAQNQKDAEHNWREVRLTMREQQRRIQELEEKLRQGGLTAQQKDDYDQLSNDYLQELNQLSKDEFVQAEHLRKFLTKVEQKVTKEAKKIAQEIVRQREAETLEEKVSIKYQDYNEVVTKYAPELREDPVLVEAIKNAPNPYELAYKLAKKTDAYKRDQELKEKNAERIQKNLSKPLSASAVGKSSPLSEANNFATMSDEQIWQMAQKFASSR